MTVALLSIGTELLRGEILDTNARWLASQLTQSGFEVVAIEAVGDEVEAVAGAIKRLCALSPLVVATGGHHQGAERTQPLDRPGHRLDLVAHRLDGDDLEAALRELGGEPPGVGVQDLASEQLGADREERDCHGEGPSILTASTRVWLAQNEASPGPRTKSSAAISNQQLHGRGRLGRPPK